jgi:hypothetical protein
MISRVGNFRPASRFLFLRKANFPRNFLRNFALKFRGNYFTQEKKVSKNRLQEPMLRLLNLHTTTAAVLYVHRAFSYIPNRIKHFCFLNELGYLWS